MLKKLFPSIFGSAYKYEQVEIQFHKAANVYGEHGTINVTHVKQGLVETPVRFVFVGLTTPPKLDRNTFNHIWEEARAQGYIPHFIASYGRDNEIVSVDAAAVAEQSAQVWRRGENTTLGDLVGSNQ